MKINKEIYFKEILEQTPRLLGLLDRDLSSKTYGCFDRQHWGYAISDISQARKQEGVLTLALLYKIKRKDNPYYGNKQVIEWANAALNFWARIQYKNGSFDDLYPYENSFVATAFSSYAVSETLLQLPGKVKERERIILSLKKAANWLHKKKETKALNQESGAVIFLYNLFLLTNNPLYKRWAEKKLIRLIKKQSGEGWFYEYGGPDIGYLSLTIDYLAKYYKKTKDERALKALKKAVNFICYFIHPDYTFGGNYGTRSTEYLIPHGFELLSKELPTARTISFLIRKGLYNKTTIAPSSIDDKYLLYLSYTYLQAYLNAGELDGDTAIFKKIFSKNFEQSGIWIFSDKNFYLIVNYKKGGTLKLLFKKNSSSLNDSGIILQNHNGKSLTSCWLNNNEVNFTKNGILIRGALWQVLNKKIDPFKNLTLRGFQLTLGRSEFISTKVKELLRKKLILNAKKSLASFSRKVAVEDKYIGIIDEIQNFPKIAGLIFSSKSSFIYGESSNYFQLSDLDHAPIVYTGETLKKIKGSRIRITRVYNELGKLTDTKISPGWTIEGK